MNGDLGTVPVLWIISGVQSRLDPNAAALAFERLVSVRICPSVFGCKANIVVQCHRFLLSFIVEKKSPRRGRVCRKY